MIWDDNILSGDKQIESDDAMVGACISDIQKYLLKNPQLSEIITEQEKTGISFKVPVSVSNLISMLYDPAYSDDSKYDVIDKINEKINSSDFYSPLNENEVLINLYNIITDKDKFYEAEFEIDFSMSMTVSTVASYAGCEVETVKPNEQYATVYLYANFDK